MSEVTFDFKGKNFVVTGASSGIGKQITLELLQAGANVLAAARRKELMDEIYKDYPEQVVTAKIDVTKPEEWEPVLKNFVAEKGKFHGSVYSAGTFSKTISVKSLNELDLQETMSINCFGAILLLGKLIRSIYSHKNTSHVWISSLGAKIGDRGKASYNASKGAMLGALKTIAYEIGGKGHRLNAVCPGWVKTEMTDFFIDTMTDSMPPGTERYLFGVGKPEDVSGMVLFLLSDRASWITGTEFILDGGCTSSP